MLFGMISVRDYWTVIYHRYFIILYIFLPTRIPLLSRVKMVTYEVTVFTGNMVTATTFNNVFVKLVGTDGESDHTWLLGFKGAASFYKGAVSLDYLALC